MCSYGHTRTHTADDDDDDNKGKTNPNPSSHTQSLPNIQPTIYLYLVPCFNVLLLLY